MQKHVAMALGGNRLVIKELMHRLRIREEADVYERTEAKQAWYDIKQAQQSMLDDARPRGRPEMRLTRTRMTSFAIERQVIGTWPGR